MEPNTPGKGREFGPSRTLDLWLRRWLLLCFVKAQVLSMLWEPYKSILTFWVNLGPFVVGRSEEQWLLCADLLETW